jgi:hypothetical protein
MARVHTRRAGLGLLLLIGLAAAPASAQYPVAASPDKAVVLDATVVTDQSVALDDLAGTTTPVDLGPLPAGVDVTAYHLRPNGDRLFAIDKPAVLGGVVVEPRDVVRYDGTGYQLAWQGSQQGIPPDVGIDAVTETTNALILSFDKAADLGNIVVADEDLLGRDDFFLTYQLFFDGSAEGIAAGLDLDGVHALDDGRFAMSFDRAGSVSGVAFADEDVLLFDPAGAPGMQWSLAYDGSAQDADWVAADLDAVAVPEPAATPGVLAGIAGLAALGRWRSSRRR